MHHKGHWSGHSLTFPTDLAFQLGKKPRLLRCTLPLQPLLDKGLTFLTGAKDAAPLSPLTYHWARLVLRVSPMEHLSTEWEDAYIIQLSRHLDDLNDLHHSPHSNRLYDLGLTLPRRVAHGVLP